jgi:hypothetical protein
MTSMKLRTYSVSHFLIFLDLTQQNVRAQVSVDVQRFIGEVADEIKAIPFRFEISNYQALK